MTSELGIVWSASFRCEEEGLLMKESPHVIDALTKTPFWPEFRIRAVWDDDERRVGEAEPLGSLASIKKIVKSGETLYLARDNVDRARTNLRVEIGAGPTGIAIGAIFCGSALEQMGLSALDSFADLLADLAVPWRARGVRLSEASAEPISRPTPFTYPRIRPPRVTKPTRQRAAVVDVLDAKMPASAKHPQTAVATKALAIASVPENVTRRERDGVVIIRWVNDPCNGDELAAASAAHERWLYALLPSTPDGAYNEDGDLRLAEGKEPDAPGLDLLTSRGSDYFGHVAVDGVNVPAAPPRRLADGRDLVEVRILAPSRTVAVELQRAARSAGYDRVVYRGDGGYLWDPAPPGMWAT